MIIVYEHPALIEGLLDQYRNMVPFLRLHNIPPYFEEAEDNQIRGHSWKDFGVDYLSHVFAVTREFPERMRMIREYAEQHGDMFSCRHIADPAFMTFYVQHHSALYGHLLASMGQFVDHVSHGNILILMRDGIARRALVAACNAKGITAKVIE